MHVESPIHDVNTGDRKQSAARSRRQASLELVLGHIIGDLLHNPKITDIMLNPNGILWCEEHGKGRRKVGELSASRAESVIRLVASHMGAEATHGLSKTGRI